MNLNETILLTSISGNSKPKFVDMKPARGIYISGITACPRCLWLGINKPVEYNGVKLVYYNNVTDANGEYITDMGQSVEDTMERQLSRNKSIELIGKQVPLDDLDGKIRGRIDFAIHHEKLGIGILDAKGMSDKVFSRFLVTPTLKEFNISYYMQVAYYIHILDCEWGAIVGVNRSNGNIALKMISKEESKNDFEFYRNRSYKIIQAKSVNEVECDRNHCDYCIHQEACQKIDEVNGVTHD